jgi:hypothetical protein
VGRTDETGMGSGRPGMPSLPGAHENCGSDPFPRRYWKNSRLSWPAVVPTACDPGRTHAFGSTGLVLNTAQSGLWIRVAGMPDSRLEFSALSGLWT